ncbi:MAG: hypothetical protein LUG17_03190, partial [Clostridiales bacterium]|nr:hypothetical protein [Clostridiales bacterium]
MSQWGDDGRRHPKSVPTQKARLLPRFFLSEFGFSFLKAKKGSLRGKTLRGCLNVLSDCFWVKLHLIGGFHLLKQPFLDAGEVIGDAEGHTVAAVQGVSIAVHAASTRVDFQKIDVCVLRQELTDNGFPRILIADTVKAACGDYAAFFLIKAFNCIGFFVITTAPPYTAALWALHEAAPRIASAYECLFLWT